MSSNPILVEVSRGPLVESAHRGAVAVVDADGAVVVSLGDVDRPVFPRSAIKVLQALPLVTSGAADRLGLADDELAIACASHNGEPEHVAVVDRMLAKAGLHAAALECGTHWPRRERQQREMAKADVEADARHNNCSGKHAGFLCVACAMAAREGGVGPRAYAKGYVRPEHPVMRVVGEAISTATGVDVSHAPLGTDGCSIPTWAIALRPLALAFARIGTGRGLPAEHAAAARRLRRAVARHPFMVAGSGRFDTQVMQAFGERVFCKVGAEGMYGAALPELGLGIAIKMDDGNNARAVEVAMAAVLASLLRLRDDASAPAGVLRTLAAVPLRNWNQIEVGALRPAPALQEIGRAGG